MSHAVDTHMDTGIGQPVRRVEDRRFLTGAGRYVDDIVLPGQVHGVVIASPYAHARIRSIDTTAAKAAPGVLCVLTGQDALDDGLGGMPPLFMPEDMGGPKGHRTRRPLLVADRVRCVGDRVAFVVAETLAQARDAADLVEVDYEPLDAVVALDDAVREGAPLVWDEAPGNRCCFVAYGNEAAAAEAFEKAPHAVRLRLESNRVSANSLEPRGAIGVYAEADDDYTLYTSSQNPHGARTMLCANVFHLPETQMRVVSPDVGGGFGMKADPYPEDGLVLWAARRVKRPVKWIGGRGESLAGDNHGRDQVVHAEMALDHDGRILGIRAQSCHAFGAYVVSAAVAPLNFALRFIPGVYDVPAFHAVNVGVFTHTSPTGPYRGAGRPEATYVVERLLDQAAHELGLGADEIRRRNLIRPEHLPYSTHTGFVYDSGDFPALLAQSLSLSEAEGFAARRARSAERGLLRGRGIGFFIEQGSIFNDQMGLRFDPGGTVTILAGTHSHGQGHATVFSQLVSEWLGVPMAAIRFVQGDTDKVAFGRGTYAARSSMIGGCALRLAADQIIERARPVAAMMLQAEAAQLTFDHGHYGAHGGEKRIALTDVAKGFFFKAGPFARFGVGLEATGSWNTEPPNFPNGCHIAEVEIDPETGVVRVDRYTAVDDIGTVLNPMVCEGQIHGGVAQGLGQALCEQVVYDRDSGQLLTGSFMDYGMPRADDMPEFRLQFASTRCTTNPLGVKAVGEAGTIGAPAAVMNAVLDALRPRGVQHLDMPATPARVWRALQAAAEAQPA
jgi:carbon-monoxide dehydrogenase large subunit